MFSPQLLSTSRFDSTSKRSADLLMFLAAYLSCLKHVVQPCILWDCKINVSRLLTRRQILSCMYLAQLGRATINIVVCAAEATGSE